LRIHEQTGLRIHEQTDLRIHEQTGLRIHEEPTGSFAHVDQYLGLMEYQKPGELLLLELQANPAHQNRHQTHRLH
jgi:hypothetical protein